MIPRDEIDVYDEICNFPGAGASYCGCEIRRTGGPMKTALKAVACTALLSIAAALPAFAEKPAKILLQIKPGFNPSNVPYQKQAEVTVNGKSIGGRFIITQGSAPAEKDLNLHKLNPGDTVTVNATLTDTNGSNPASCSQAFPVASQDSLACGPIEVFYNPTDNTCAILCN
jgi:hypothetical protein